MVLPGQLAVDHLYNRLYFISLTGRTGSAHTTMRAVLDKPVPQPRIGDVTPSMTREQYMSAVDHARGEIRPWRSDSNRSVGAPRHLHRR